MKRFVFVHVRGPKKQFSVRFDSVTEASDFFCNMLDIVGPERLELCMRIID